MTDSPQNQPQTASEAEFRKPLTPAAQRALAEAQERRQEAEKAEKARRQPTELNGRGGLDPARYGDWEVKGIISDF